MSLTRSPVSPLDREDGKRSKKSSTCTICLVKRTTTDDMIECSKCGRSFDHNCVFFNKNQASYFVAKSIPWCCPNCFYSDSNSITTTLSNLGSTIHDLQTQMNDCTSKLGEIKALAAGVHQELSSRVNEIENNQASMAMKVDKVELNSLSRKVNLGGVKITTKSSSINVKLLFRHIMKTIGVTTYCSSDVLLKKDQSGHVYFVILNLSVLNELYIKYNLHLSSAECEGISSGDFIEQFNLPPTTITLNFETEISEATKRLDILEHDQYAKDIKIIGIPYLIDENNGHLDKIIQKLFAHLAADIKSNEYMYRRIAKTASIIVTFNNKLVRDRAFYKYINIVKGNHEGGIGAAEIGFSFKSRIIFTDNLSASARLIHDAARQMKKDGKLHKFSSRSGRVVVKMNAAGNWNIIYSLEDLHNIAYPR